MEQHVRSTVHTFIHIHGTNKDGLGILYSTLISSFKQQARYGYNLFVHGNRTSAVLSTLPLDTRVAVCVYIEAKGASVGLEQATVWPIDSHPFIYVTRPLE